MGLVVSVDADKLLYRVIPQDFHKEKNTENPHSLGPYIKPVLGKQDSRYLQT